VRRFADHSWLNSASAVTGQFVGRHDAGQLRDSMTEIFNQLPDSVRRSLTWDQGIAMARHHQFTVATAMPVFFCEPRSPWQRGTNEKVNGLLRRYFPKGTDLSVHSPRGSPTNSTIGRARRSVGALQLPSLIASKSQPCSHDHWYPPRREPHKWGCAYVLSSHAGSISRSSIGGSSLVVGELSAVAACCRMR